MVISCDLKLFFVEVEVPFKRWPFKPYFLLESETYNNNIIFIVSNARQFYMPLQGEWANSIYIYC